MTREEFRKTVRESLQIIVAATLLGFGYTAVSGKGFFGGGTARPVPTAETPPDNDSPFIDLAQARQYFRSGTAVFVDARHAYDFNLGHIPGARNLPLAEYDERTAEIASLPRDSVLITYCDGQECNSSVDLAQKLIAGGFPHVKIFFGGWNEWRSDSLSVEPARSTGQ